MRYRASVAWAFKLDHLQSFLIGFEADYEVKWPIETPLTVTPFSRPQGVTVSGEVCIVILNPVESDGVASS